MRKGLTKAEVAKAEREAVQFLGTDFDRDSPAYKAWRQFIDASARHSELLDRLDDKTFCDKEGRVKDSKREEYEKLCSMIDAQRKAMFGLFDHAVKIVGQTFHVPEADVQQIIYDALMGNAEALPDEYQQLDGLARGRECRRLAGDIIAMIRSDKIVVDEFPIEIPYCQDCG